MSVQNRNQNQMGNRVPNLGSPPMRISNPKLTGRFAPRGNLQWDVSRALGFLENRPPRGGASLLNSLRRGDVRNIPVGKGPRPVPRIFVSPLTQDSIRDLRYKRIDFVKTLSRFKETLDKFNIPIGEFDEKRCGDKITFIKNFKDAIFQMKKKLSDLQIDPVRRPPSSLVQNYIRGLENVEVHLTQMQDELVNDKKNIDYSELRFRTPELAEFRKNLEEYWDIQDMVLHPETGTNQRRVDLMKNFSKLRLDERITVVEKLQKSLTDFIGKAEALIEKVIDKGDRTILKAFRDAAKTRLDTLSGLMHDEMRTRANDQESIRGGIGKAITLYTDSIEQLEHERKTLKKELSHLNTQWNIAEYAMRKAQSDLADVNRLPFRLPKKMQFYQNRVKKSQEGFKRINTLYYQTEEKLLSCKTNLPALIRGRKSLENIDKILRENWPQALQKTSKIMPYILNSNLPWFKNILLMMGKRKDEIKEAFTPIEKSIENMEKSSKALEARYKLNDDDRGKGSLDQLTRYRGLGIDFETYFGLRRSGLKYEDLTTFDKGLDDPFEISGRKALGKGAFNTVYTVQWKKDGKIQTRVLKEEDNATNTLKTPRSSVNTGIKISKGSNGATARNLASAILAKKLGMENILPRPDVIMNRGRIHMAMPQGRGETMSKKAGMIRENVMRQYNLARELCKLEWLDSLTGQVDRHHENYLVDIGNGNSVTVFAIDNDLCFGSLMTLPNQAKDSSGNIRNFTQYNEKEERDINGNKVVGNTSYTPQFYQNKAGPSEISYVHSIGFPALIDRSTYEALTGKNVTADSFLKDIKGYLSDDEFKAAQTRFNALQDHARALEKAGLVVDDWVTWRTKKEIINPPGVNCRVVPKNMIVIERGTNARDFLLGCGSYSYFVRDVYRNGNDRGKPKDDSFGSDLILSDI